MSALDKVHYGFRHHYKWMSPQILSYLRVWGWFGTQPCFIIAIISQFLTCKPLFPFDLKRSERPSSLIRKFCQSFDCGNEVEIPLTVTDSELFFWGRDEIVEKRDGGRETPKGKRERARYRACRSRSCPRYLNTLYPHSITKTNARIKLHNSMTLSANSSWPSRRTEHTLH